MSRDEPNIESRLEEFADCLASCQAEMQARVFAIVQDMADAEDICQRVAVILWQKFDQYQPGTSFAAWAFQAARFEAMNFVRRRRRERLFFSDETLALVADTSAAEAAAATGAQTRWASLRKCVEKLPQRQREVIQLYYESSNTIAQVADQIGRSETGVRSALCRTRRTLRSCIERLARDA